MIFGADPFLVLLLPVDDVLLEVTVVDDDDSVVFFCLRGVLVPYR